MARRIIDAAHELSQQRGSRSVLHRLLLASFLNESEGQAATACRACGVQPAAIAALLIAGTESHSPVSCVLSPESAQRAVLPMLERARQLQQSMPPPPPPITEALLFRAYCETAPPELKQLLRRLPSPLTLDLDQLARWRASGSGPPSPAPSAPREPSPAFPEAAASRPPTPPPAAGTTASKATAPRPSPAPAVPPSVRLPPSNGKSAKSRVERSLGHPTQESQPAAFDPAVREALAAARDYALIQGHTLARSVHVAVGMVALQSPLIQAALQPHGVSPERLCRALLRLVPPRALDPQTQNGAGWSENAQRILQRALATAADPGAARVDERALWQALLQDSSGIVVQALSEWGLLASLTEVVGL
jgi:ATP-dependent Clp protease ATP-binding subunit ClpA